MRILSEQTFNEVAGVVTVGGLVVVNIVQSGDVEVVDHGVGIGTGVFFGSSEADCGKNHYQGQNQGNDLLHKLSS